MTERAAQQLLDSLKAVEKPCTKGCVGITTFIKTELIADGKDKPAVKPPEGATFSANASSVGLYKGRIFDHAFQRAVEFNEHTNATRQAFRALLNKVNVRPVLCQHRVVMQSSKLTTQLDAVGIDVRTHTPVCIELKTCQLSSSIYNNYATSVCRRTPMLRCAPELPNCERSRHYLQAAFGAECLRQQLGVEKVLAVLLVKCTDTCMVYRVPASYHASSRFARLTMVPVVKKSETHLFKKKEVNTKSSLPPKRAATHSQLWPMHTNEAQNAVKSMGFTLVKITGPGSRKFKLLKRGAKIIAVAVYVEKWNSMLSNARALIRSELTKYIARAKQNIALAGYQLNRSLTPLTLTRLTPGGRLQLIMAGTPFTVQSI